MSELNAHGDKTAEPMDFSESERAISVVTSNFTQSHLYHRVQLTLGDFHVVLSVPICTSLDKLIQFAKEKCGVPARIPVLLSVEGYAIDPSRYSTDPVLSASYNLTLKMPGNVKTYRRYFPTFFCCLISYVLIRFRPIASLQFEFD